MGARAVENLRLVLAELQVATVRAQVGFSLFTDFENFTVFNPAETQEKDVNAMLDQVIAWSGALRPLRESVVDQTTRVTGSFIVPVTVAADAFGHEPIKELEDLQST